MRDIWFCKSCVRLQEIEHNGINGYCVGCGTPVINNGDIFHAAWFPAAEFIAGEISPPAGVALETLKRIDESASPNLEPLLNFAGLLVLGIAGGLILREVIRNR